MVLQQVILVFLVRLVGIVGITDLAVWPDLCSEELFEDLEVVALELLEDLVEVVQEQCQAGWFHWEMMGSYLTLADQEMLEMAVGLGSGSE